MTQPRDTTPFPTNYIGAYVGNNFDETKKYETVLHQKKNPIYNVDQNEKAYIEQFRRRRMMQALVGSACVEDAFQIVGTGASNEFTVTGGNLLGGAIPTPKHAYINGWQILADVQTTYNDNNTDLNEGLGFSATSGTPPPLITPVGARTDEVYLDVFRKEILGTDDVFLIPDTRDKSVTNRERLISEIRVVENGTTPPDFIDGDDVEHFTFHLATIERFAGQDEINIGDVTDARRTFTFGTLANGGLGLIDPGGMQSAVDNTSGAGPSASRHLLLGEDLIQEQLDNASVTIGEQFLAGIGGMQDALDNALGTAAPSAGNPLVLEDGLAADIMPFTSTTGLTSDNAGDAIDEVNTNLLNVKLLAPLVYAECGYPADSATQLKIRYRVGDRTGVRIMEPVAELTLDTGTVGAGGLDAGTLQANQLYQVYAIGHATGALPDQVIATLSDSFGDSQNATLELNLPGTYTLYKWLHHFVTDSAANILPATVSSNQIKFLISGVRNSLTTTGSADTAPTNYGVTSLLPINHTRIARIIFHTTQASLAYALPPGSTANPTTNDSGFLITNTTDQSNPSQEFTLGINGTGIVTMSGIPNNVSSGRGIAVMGCEYFH